jgi:hypothetical protein
MSALRSRSKKVVCVILFEACRTQPGSPGRLVITHTLLSGQAMRTIGVPRQLPPGLPARTLVLIFMENSWFLVSRSSVQSARYCPPAEMPAQHVGSARPCRALGSMSSRCGRLSGLVLQRRSRCTLDEDHPNARRMKSCVRDPVRGLSGSTRFARYTRDHAHVASAVRRGQCRGCNRDRACRREPWS